MKSPIDFTKVKTFSLKDRKSKVGAGALGTPPDKGTSVEIFLRGLPGILAAEEFRQAARAIAESHRGGKAVVLGMGAHPIKVGLSPLIIDFMEKGIITAVAMNGAGIIHDFELAFAGETSEEVEEGLQAGSFGMARETGEFLNRAITEGVRSQGLGIGASVGKKMLEEKLPHENLSVLATGMRMGIPIAVHVAVGTDTIHMHPEADGTAIGEGSLRDFHLLTSVVACLQDGVFINLGSAVIIPEVFLKALSLARNLGYTVTQFTTIDMDFIRHYRPAVNVVSRPTQLGGTGYHFTGHHEIMFPLLCVAVLEYL